MTESISTNPVNSHLFDRTNENDVVPLQHTTMATEEPSGSHTHNDYYSTLIGTSGAGSVSALSLNDTFRMTATATAEASVSAVATATVTIPTATVTSSNTNSNEADKMIENIAISNNNNNRNGHNFLNKTNGLKQNNGNSVNKNVNNNNNNNNNCVKGKRRRRKSSKQKTNSKPYKKSNWKYSMRARNGTSSLVPYNTNQFLMEEHMPEIQTEDGRYRDSSFSYDSDNDKEEYLSKEFYSVYEKARSERLYEMSKPQLIQEYLQLEASYDKLCNSLSAQMENAKDVQFENGNENAVNVFKRLTERIQELTAENHEIRRQMADIRNRDNRHNNGGIHQNKTSLNNQPVILSANIHNNSKTDTSEDSESDSTTSSSSSSSSNSDSDSGSSLSKRSRSLAASVCNSSKSSLDLANHMSGISDNDDGIDETSHLLLNGYDPSVDTSNEPIFIKTSPNRVHEIIAPSQNNELGT